MRRMSAEDYQALKDYQVPKYPQLRYPRPGEGGGYPGFIGGRKVPAYYRKLMYTDEKAVTRRKAAEVLMKYGTAEQRDEAKAYLSAHTMYFEEKEITRRKAAEVLEKFKRKKKDKDTGEHYYSSTEITPVKVECSDHVKESKSHLSEE